MPDPNHVSCAGRGKAVVVVVGKRFGRCSRFPVLDSGNWPRQNPEDRLQQLARRAMACEFPYFQAPGAAISAR